MSKAKIELDAQTVAAWIAEKMMSDPRFRSFSENGVIVHLPKAKRLTDTVAVVTEK